MGISIRTEGTNEGLVDRQRDLQTQTPKRPAGSTDPDPIGRGGVYPPGAMCGLGLSRYDHSLKQVLARPPLRPACFPDKDTKEPKHVPWRDARRIHPPGRRPG